MKSLFAQPVVRAKIKQPSPKETFTQDRQSSFLIHRFGVKLYLFPDRKSETLKILKFGEMVVYDSLSLEPPSSDWVPLKTEDKLVGYVLRSAVLRVPKTKYLSSIVFESEKLLHLASTDLKQRMEITDALFALTKEGDFTGDDFTLIRAKAGFALKRTVDWMNEKNVKPDDSPELLDFLKKHQSKLLFDYSSNKYYVDSNYFWKLIENHPRTKHSDYAGYLASEVLPNVDCKGELGCRLDKLRRSKMRYIYLFPNGNYVPVYFKEVVKELKDITKDPDAIACYQPVSAPIATEIQWMNRYVVEYNLRYRKEILPLVQILQKECLK
ncbi:SH3 domain-containing protein [Leptospira idonii]|uniref:SH3 domain-containing protein n=1 Tax=Leptospira idonii TaxID=1193500 RepID=UPI001FEA5483|nr:SH3 domain-containing protein [Leptospira idonii]